MKTWCIEQFANKRCRFTKKQHKVNYGCAHKYGQASLFRATVEQTLLPTETPPSKKSPPVPSVLIFLLKFHFQLPSFKFQLQISSCNLDFSISSDGPGSSGLMFPLKLLFNFALFAFSVSSMIAWHVFPGSFVQHYLLNWK